MTDSPILELQRLAQSGETSISELLRRTKVLAVKLNIEEARSWIDHELEGYPTGEVPEYRIVPAELQAFTRFRGWETVPWEAANPAQAFFSRARIGHPIPQIEDFAKAKGHQLALITQEEIDLLSQFGNQDLAQFRLARLIPRNEFVKIIEAVRTKILDWTLALEQRGIMGHGMKFNKTEIREAGTVPFRLSDKITLVLMSANPDSDSPLQVEKEQNRITKERNGSKHQERVRIEALPDADFLGVAKSLRLHAPTIVHITGHGAEDGSIVLRDEEGQPYAMHPEGLARLLVLHKKTLRMIVLSACYSSELGRILANDIDCVIGMNSDIDDDAAILFSQTFYSSLFDGVSVNDAFKTGMSAIVARYPSEAHNPILSVRSGISPDQLYVIQ